jgi:serpin B
MNRQHVDFALALHHELPAEGNLTWSPYSVASALGLAATGARGRTRDELARVLAGGEDLAELGRLLADSASLRDAEIAVANTLWTRLGLDVLETYRKAVLGWPAGGIEEADFQGEPETARRRINDDVEQTTRGLIKDLLADGTVTPETVAIIVNALYLKIGWRRRFPEGATRPAPFHAPAGTIEVPTMRQQERMGYAERAGWRMATLPTASDVVVDVILPVEGSRLTTGILTELYDVSASTRVDLELPRFRVEASAVLNEPLGRLGVETAFTRDADFSGITSISDTDRILIDQVVHKAVLRVDEQGFEGAAATAVMMGTVSMDISDPVAFHVDRPFLVIVRHAALSHPPASPKASTGAIYFLARVVSP